MKFYTVDVITNEVNKVANSLEEFLDGVNRETIDTENNWVASERTLDYILLNYRQGATYIS